jgi:hypothetical protein
MKRCVMASGSIRGMWDVVAAPVIAAMHPEEVHSEPEPEGARQHSGQETPCLASARCCSAHRSLGSDEETPAPHDGCRPLRRGGAHLGGQQVGSAAVARQRASPPHQPTTLPSSHPVRRRPTHRGAGVVHGVQVERATVRTTWTPWAASARLCLGRRRTGWELTTLTTTDSRPRTAPPPSRCRPIPRRRHRLDRAALCGDRLWAVRLPDLQGRDPPERCRAADPRGMRDDQHRRGVGSGVRCRR